MYLIQKSYLHQYQFEFNLAGILITLILIIVSFMQKSHRYMKLQKVIFSFVLALWKFWTYHILLYSSPPLTHPRSISPSLSIQHYGLFFNSLSPIVLPIYKNFFLVLEREIINISNNASSFDTKWKERKSQADFVYSWEPYVDNFRNFASWLLALWQLEIVRSGYIIPYKSPRFFKLAFSISREPVD